MILTYSIFFDYANQILDQAIKKETQLENISK